METPVPNTWWFIPWKHTQKWNSDDTPPAPYTKLLYRDTGLLKDEHRGSGMIIEETTGKIVGCYKKHADTGLEAHQTKVDLAMLQGDASLIAADREAIMQIPVLNRTDEQKELVQELQEELDDMPKECRRLSGLLLDPRPQYIAEHQSEVLYIHPVMAGEVLKNYGDEYRHLENRIRTAMGNAFDLEEDLPIYRKVDRQQLLEAGLEEPDFSEPQ
jgi:hypothetical protein